MLGTNHLSDLGRLLFWGTIEVYMEMFLVRKVHARHLSLVQQAQLYTGGLLDPVQTDVEL